MKFLSLVLACTIASMMLFLSNSCGTTESTSETTGVSAEDITRYLAELSKDEYLGRKPFTEGETKTVAFLQSEMKKIGLAPGNGDSYLQEVPLIEITGMPSEELILKRGNESESLQISEDFVSFTQREQAEVSVENSEMIFCGYGIVAPEYGWNDYRDLDMKGKTAVVLVNDPGFGSEDESFFKGNTMTYYGRWTYKYEEAERQGAEAIMIVHETASAGYPWFVVQNGWSGAALQLQSEDGHPNKPALQGWVTLDVAKSLFEKAGHDLGEEIRKARTAEFRPFSLNTTMSASLTNTFKKDVSNNVIGMIKGTERPDETIIYSAHWDHLGVGKVVEGDSIYNGAVDNATGTSCVLSIAKAMMAGPAPKRSVVFLLVTAEEQGLLGSQWYGENPIFPVDKTVANLNMDGMLSIGEVNDLTVTGYGQSEMDDYATTAAKAQGRYVVPDQEPEKGYFFRSDHFNFAKVGIPAMYVEGGTDHKEKGKEYGRQMSDQYRTTNYHQPSDEYDPETWNLDGLMQDAELYLAVGNRLANESTFPKWKENSEFKGIREVKD